MTTLFLAALAGYCLVLDYSGLFVLAALSGYALLVWRRQAPAQRAVSDLAPARQAQHLPRSCLRINMRSAIR
jgi:hypothetical protein